MTQDTNNTGVSRRGFLTAAGAAGVTAALAGCSGGSGDTTTTSSGTTSGTTQSTTTSGDESLAVTITQGQMPTTLDPQDHRETTTDNVVLQAYEGLLSRSAEGSVQAELATEWERVEEGRVRFHLREGVTFHSGNDLTAEDVAYSINRIVKEDVGFVSPQSDQLPGVTGAEVADVDGMAVDVISDGLNPIVFASFATYCDVMEKAWVQENSKNYVAQHMNGTGPFKLKNYEEDVQVVFERNEDYWRDPAAVTELTFDAASESSVRVNKLIENESDIIVNVPPQDISRVRSADNASVTAVPSTRVIYNAMRYDVEPFDSVDFRQAMNHAVDMESIVENVLSGFGAVTNQPTLENFFGYNPDISNYEFDREKAESLVESSGYAGAEIELHTPVGRYLKDVEVAQAVVNQINQLSNVSASLKQRDFGALAGELADGDITTGPHWYLIGWGNATFDASQTLIPLLTSGGSLTSWENDEFDSLVEQAQNEGDQDKREQLLQEANQLAHDEAPWIFLNRQFSVYGQTTRISWEARSDERIDAYAIGHGS
ncbi:ABC transporter substrate-binding protein [Halocalculus aciditolerans]|uniref:ABC transporter substrate-binding protein n=1 Tax=Halocalculus aciditolerans TaxID=1383812 RepID=A0A830F8W6_9EURY|nr:ABC transporter substrate-binding protein [Halocalculus aciditolerans]